MKLSSVSKEIWNNINVKGLLPVATNGGTYDRCASSLSEAENEYLLGVSKNISAPDIIIFS